MNIPESIKKLIYYRQHPEAALRYLPIVDTIKRLNLSDSKILEVGSGSYGITPYLKRKVTGLDSDFSEPNYQLLEQINGSAVSLPFKNNQFEIVILSDVLEHIPDVYRNKTVTEAVRVSDKFVVISGPFGKEAAGQDLKFYNFSKKHLKQTHIFLKEHVELGLPELKDITGILEGNNKVKKIEKIGEYLNLNVREFIMKIFLTDNKLVYYFYLKGLMPFIPILRRLNHKPCYRTLLLIHLR